MGMANVNENLMRVRVLAYISPQAALYGRQKWKFWWDTVSAETKSVMANMAASNHRKKEITDAEEMFEEV